MAIKKISANLLGNNAVTAASIAGGAISAADIADNSITAAKISTSTFAIDSLTVNTSDLVVDTANNRVGIGTSSPASALEVIGTDPNDNVSRVINIKDDRSYAADVGGSISLFGKYNSSGNYSTFAQIIGAKTNGTDGEYSGYLSFKTRSASALPTERMRIDSSGNVGITSSAKFGFGGVTTTTSHYIKYDSGIDGLELNGWAGLKFTTGTNGANERMRITSDGTMGFGMSPLGTNNGSAFFDGNVSSKDGFMTTASDLQMIAPSAGNTIFVRDNGNESMRITSAGTLAINTQSPSSTPLHVNSFSGNTLTAVFESPASNNFDVQFRSHSYYGGITFWSDFYGSNLQYGSISQYINGGMYATANRGYWYFQVGNAGTTRIQYQMDWDNHKWFTNTAYNGAMELTYVGHLRINGSLYQSYNFSDERLKENVQTLTGSLEKVKQLRGVSFNFKESKEGIYTSEDNQIGVVAQELEQHYPELISEQAEMTEEGEDGIAYKYVHYEKLTPILIEAIKEQQTIIDDLKSRLDSAGL